jgi:hypothetical protein
MTRTTSPTQKELCWVTERQIRGSPQPLVAVQGRGGGHPMELRGAGRPELDPSSNPKHNQRVWLHKGQR